MLKGIKIVILSMERALFPDCLQLKNVENLCSLRCFKYST